MALAVTGREMGSCASFETATGADYGWMDHPHSCVEAWEGEGQKQEL